MLGEMIGPLQHTLNTVIGCRGIGLHSGRRIAMQMVPAPQDTGIVFRRTDCRGEVRAVWENSVESPRCTVLSNAEGMTVSTIEHLMAALAGAAIDNLIVELDGPEVPIMDGSAAPFVFLIECAGVVEQPSPRRMIRVLKQIRVGGAGVTAALVPDDALSMSFEIDFDNPLIRSQRIAMEVDTASFKTELSRARTFGLLDEVDRLRAAGLARGGSLDNVVVVSGDRVMNCGGLRYDDEFVRHKLLDALGDLYLAGAPIVGRFCGCRSGHAHNRRLLAALFADDEAWVEGAATVPAAPRFAPCGEELLVTA
jgi:UDP-3-O-[3-hydroxymyristoyl] N-acetylglucosamine deacetylase